MSVHSVNMAGLAKEPHPKLRAVAQDLEANFLAEMLKFSGLGESRESFGGGAGEDAFASMLTTEYADLLAAQGGVGLGEQIYQSLVERMAE
ncbi:rod-binding protein [Paracoccaceae bacterium GXU_MW_L88]